MTSDTHPTSTAQRIAAPLLRIATRTALAVGVLAVLTIAIGPRLLSYRTTVVLTGSMRGTFNPGDLIVLTPEPLQQLHVGQPVSFHAPIADHRVYTHRVIWLHRNADGSVNVRTKGDANSVADPWTAHIPAHTTMWVERFPIAHAGEAIRALRTPWILHLLMYGGLLGSVLIGAMSIWTSSPSPQSSEAADGASSDQNGAVA